MTVVAHDTTRRTRTGLSLALLSAVSFGLSGALARPLLESGWTPGAVVLARIWIGAVVVAPIGLLALRGRWATLRAQARLVLLYGTLAVAGAQFAYFSAVQHIQVGPALLLEYTAPAAIVLWLWIVRGERPGPITLVGAATCAVGLVLVLDLLTGTSLNPVGVAWALTAMVGAATYFLINAETDTGLPPLTLAGVGLLVGALVLTVAAVLGVLPVRLSSETVAYAGVGVSPVTALVTLGVLTAAVAYVSGVAAGRRLGSRLASFVALSEVVAAILWAWLLLDELPGPAQLLGGVVILVGVVLVELGEPKVVEAVPAAQALPGHDD